MVEHNLSKAGVMLDILRNEFNLSNSFVGSGANLVKCSQKITKYPDFCSEDDTLINIS